MHTVPSSNLIGKFKKIIDNDSHIIVGISGCHISHLISQNDLQYLLYYYSAQNAKYSVTDDIKEVQEIEPSIIRQEFDTYVIIYKTKE